LFRICFSERDFGALEREGMEGEGNESVVDEGKKRKVWGWKI